MHTIKYNPNDHYHFNAALLVAGVIVGIILGFAFQSVLLLILAPVISQYQWLLDGLNRIVYADQIKALNRLTNFAKLADNRDNYAIGRYRNADSYRLDISKDLELIQKQHPNIETINYYLKRAVKEIEEEKKTSQTDQSKG